MKPIGLSWVHAVAVATIGLMATDSRATTFLSTKSRDLAELSDAVVRGTVKSIRSELDASGAPWTLYTISIDEMLMGEVESLEFTFRSMGGPMPDDTLLQLVSAPVITLGDSFVFFHASGGICDVVGMEHGMFWIRNNANGDARLVNHQGLALAGFDAEDAILSDEYVPSARQLATGTAPERGSSAPPAADLNVILDELAAFAATNVQQPKRIVSVNGVKDVPSLAPDRAPEGAP